MQAGLVLVSVKVRSSELQHSFVIPPEEKAYSSLQQVCHHDIGPEFCAIDVLGCELHQRRDAAPLRIERVPTDNVDRDQDAATNGCKHKEDVSHHTHEAQENDRIQPDCIHEIILLHVLHSREPTERLLVQRSRPMLFVRMFGAWCINSGVSRS